MDASAIINTLSPLVPGAAFEAVPSVDFATIYVPADRLVDACRALRDAEPLQFNTIIEVTAADYFPRAPRFEVFRNSNSAPSTPSDAEAPHRRSGSPSASSNFTTSAPASANNFVQ